MTSIRFLASLLIALVAAGGCSKGPSLKTVPVSGKVTLGDQPLSGATVTFLAETPTSGLTPTPATGVTGADGTYKLSTLASGGQIVAGAPPGSYKVIITKTAGPGGSGPGVTAEMSPEERMQKMKDMSPEERAKMAGSAAQIGTAGAKSEIPTRYGKVEESGLVATVKPSGSQTFDFPLTP